MYGNIYEVGGTEIKDVKIYYRDRFAKISHNYLESNLPFISTDDESFLTIEKNLLKEKFKNDINFIITCQKSTLRTHGLESCGPIS